MTQALVISRRAGLLQALLTGPLGPQVQWREATGLAEVIVDAPVPGPDLVVVDLPSLPGEEAAWLPWLRARFGGAVLLAVVREAGSSLRRALGADLDGLLLDPFDLAEVEQQLRRGMDRHRPPVAAPVPATAAEAADPGEALAQFLKGLTHEINNPMSSVSAALEILDTEVEDAGHKRRFEMMREHIDRIDETVEELEAFVADRKPNKMEMDLVPLLAELVPAGSAWRPPARQLVLADEPQLRKVFSRLIGLFAAEDPGEVRTTLEEGPGRVLFTLSGPAPTGLPENPATLFLPYHRAAHQDYRESLRLAACRGIVRAHGGKLGAQREGERLRIEVALPSLSAPGSAEAPAH